MIIPFTQGPSQTVAKLNEMVRALNSLLKFEGDGIIRVLKSPQGYTINLDINQLMPRMPKTAGGGSSSAIWATVVRGLRYATTAPVDAGYSSYTVRLTSDSSTEYASGTTYADGDTVYYDAETAPDSDPIVYTSLQDGNTGNTPGSSAEYWSAQDQIVPLAIAVSATGYNVEADLRTTLRWYNVGDVVPLYLYDGYYYFAQLFIPCTDSDGYGSLAWNEDEFRAMAVYK